MLTEGSFLPYLLHSEQRTTSDPGGFVQELRLTKDRKVSPWVSYGSSGKSRNVLPNTFGLSAGSENSCPGATDLCSTVCYAGRLETVYTSVGRMLAHNLAVRRACGNDAGSPSTA